MLIYTYLPRLMARSYYLQMKLNKNSFISQLTEIITAELTNKLLTFL